MIDKKYIAVIVIVILIVAYFWFTRKKSEKLKTKKKSKDESSNPEPDDNNDEQDEQNEEDDNDEEDDEEGVQNNKKLKHDAEVLYKTIHTKMAAGMTDDEFKKLFPQYANSFIFAEIKQLYNVSKSAGRNSLNEIRQEDYEIVLRRES